MGMKMGVGLKGGRKGKETEGWEKGVGVNGGRRVVG